MNKTIEKIRSILDEKKLDGLYGKGVENPDIDQVENIFDIKLPFSYRCFLNEYGWGYFGSLEAICGLGTDIPPEWKLSTDLVEVIQMERSSGLSVPNNFIPFYQNGAGDWYAFDGKGLNQDGESKVYFLSHESIADNGFEAIIYSENFLEWLVEKLE